MFDTIVFIINNNVFSYCFLLIIFFIIFFYPGRLDVLILKPVNIVSSNSSFLKNYFYNAVKTGTFVSDGKQYTFDLKITDAHALEACAIEGNTIAVLCHIRLFRRPHVFNAKPVPLGNELYSIPLNINA